MNDLYAIFDQSRLGPLLELEQAGTVLLINAVADVNRTALALQPKTIGRWYAERLVWGSGDLLASIGIATADASLTTYAGGDAFGWGYRLALGKIHTAGASVASVPVAVKGDVIGVLLDMLSTQPTVTWSVNGTPVYTANLASTGPWMLATSLGDVGESGQPTGMRCFLNTGQRAFENAAGDLGWYEPGVSVNPVNVASEDWLSAPTDAIPNHRYAGLIDGGNNELRAVRSLDFWPWQRGITTGAMVLTALNSGGQFDNLLTGDARDQAVTVWRINSDQTYADRIGLFRAIIDSVGAVDDLSVKLTCRDPLGLLEVPLQRMMIRPDADPASANQPVPIVLGACRNVLAVLTDGPNLIYRVSDAPILGIGYVRDSGYPLSPAAAPPDFTLDALKTSLVLDHSPVGKITVDVSSVGGDHLPSPTDDILGGKGAPFTGSDGSAPTGFSNGGDTPPVMDGGLLSFPQVATSATIKVQGDIATSGYGGMPYKHAGIRISWRNSAGGEISFTESPSLTGTNATATYTVQLTAPAGATYGVLEFFAAGHTSGTATFSNPKMWYVMPDASLVSIPINNPGFAGLDGWTPEMSAQGNLWQSFPGYVVKQPDTSGATGAATDKALRNNYLALDIPSNPTAVGWLKLTSVTKYGAGQSYKLSVTIPSLPEGYFAIALATGTTADTIIAQWRTAGTYTLTITNSDGTDQDLYLLGIPLKPGTVPVPPTVASIAVLDYDDTYNPDPISLVPATLHAIPLADYMHEVLDMRAARIGMPWSLADAQAIDTATGYAGIGVYLSGGETAAAALDVALASYTACKWVDGDGMLRISRLRDPAGETPVGTLDINAMDADMVPVMDPAPGLTTQMGVRRNWAELSDGDLVSASLNFPLAVRQSMLRQYQQIVSSAQPLAGAYRHALYAPPIASTFDQAADGQAEIDRVAKIYTTLRWFYAVPIELADYPDLDLDQVWTLVYPRYGLTAGKPVLVVDFQPDLLAGTANIILWG